MTDDGAATLARRTANVAIEGLNLLDNRDVWDFLRGLDQ